MLLTISGFIVFLIALFYTYKLSMYLFDLKIKEDDEKLQDLEELDKTHKKIKKVDKDKVEKEKKEVEEFRKI